MCHKKHRPLRRRDEESGSCARRGDLHHIARRLFQPREPRLQTPRHSIQSVVCLRDGRRCPRYKLNRRRGGTIPQAREGLERQRMAEMMTTDVRALLDRTPFDHSAVADLREVLGRDPSRYRTLRDAVAAMRDREKGHMKPETYLRLGVGEVMLGRYPTGTRAPDQGRRYRAGPLLPRARPREPSALERGAIEAFAAAAKAGYEPKLSELHRAGALRRAGKIDEARTILDGLEKLAGQLGRVPLPDAAACSPRRRRAARPRRSSSRRRSASIATTPARCSSSPTSTTSTATTTRPSTTTSAARPVPLSRSPP